MSIGRKKCLEHVCVDFVVCRSLIYGNFFKIHVFQIGFVFASRETKVSGNEMVLVGRKSECQRDKISDVD